MIAISELLEKIKYLDEDSRNLIIKAYNKLTSQQQGVVRQSATSALQHSLAVSLKLAELGLDKASIATALLHDLAQEKNISTEELEKEFSPQVAKLVNSVNKLHRVKLRLGNSTTVSNEKQVETLRKMFIAMAEDLRVVLIKLIDRLDEMKRLNKLPPAEQKEIAFETLEVYAPLAYRLGMGEVKGELEDLAFPYAYPREYEYLSKLTLPKFEERKEYIKKVAKILEEDLKKAKIAHQIHGRAKHLYSLYKKLKKYNYEMDKIYDLVALRVIVPHVSDCYAVLGLIHKKWKPLVGRIKDYIAVPKPNGYQSLHTTVFCENGEIVEFQIRTHKMHEQAEYGVAAHWYYTDKVRPKEFKHGPIRTEKDIKVPEKELKWVKELLVWQRELKESRDFIESLKLDLFNDRIFVFTPKGDVVDLPQGSTPIDFAYHIHSEIGNHALAAKANGKIIPLNAELSNGDIVEIITAKNIKPSLDWLQVVKTAKARERIRSWFRKKLEEK